MMARAVRSAASSLRHACAARCVAVYVACQRLMGLRMVRMALTIRWRVSSQA